MLVKEGVLVLSRFSRVNLLLWPVLALGLFALAGCGQVGGSSDQPAATEVPATPTVGIESARKVFQAGVGELTYDELVALRHDIVGDPPDPSVITDSEK